MGSLNVVGRLPTRPSYLMCRILFVLAAALLFILASRFYVDVKDVLSVCKFGKDFRCELPEDVQVLSDEEEESTTQEDKQTGTSFSAAPTSASGKTSWISDLGSSLGNLSGSKALREWNYSRDANDTNMSEKQCQLSFPEMGYEIARAQAQYDKKRYGISEKDIKNVDITNGRVRASIRQGKVGFLFYGQLFSNAIYQAHPNPILQL
jgi:hypothetical protein